MIGVKSIKKVSPKLKKRKDRSETTLIALPPNTV